MNSIKKLPQTIIYAARINDRDVLRSSSSGGLFTVLSDPFLRCGGAIVCSVYQYDSHRIEFWLRPTACVKIFNKEISIADYVRFFFSDVPLRPSCYQCPFAKIERETDMTIGDFWHIEEKKTEFYDSEGNSLLLIHTEKGSAFFEQCKNTLQIERSTADECWQLNLERPTERPPHRDEILQGVLNIWHISNYREILW